MVHRLGCEGIAPRGAWVTSVTGISGGGPGVQAGEEADALFGKAGKGSSSVLRCQMLSV
jgi:hypothetical protein